MGSSASRRIKQFFKNKTDSEESVEILRMFILPFVAKYRGWGLSIDEILSAFFAGDLRHIFYAKCTRKFRMPGAKYRPNGGKPLYGIGNREIEAGTFALVVHDKKDGTAKIEVKTADGFDCYLLNKPEFDTIKDYLEEV